MEIILDLRQHATLTDLFDAGLRPTRFPGLESSHCEVRKTPFQVLLPGDRQLECLAPSAVFIINEEDNILKMEWGNEKNYTGKEAWELVKKHSEGLRYDAAKTNVILQKLAGSVTSNKDTQAMISASSEPVVACYFRNSFKKEAPLRFHVDVTWNYPLLKYGSRGGRLTPPKGYEHLSMAISPDYPVPKQSSPSPTRNNPPSGESGNSSASQNATPSPASPAGLIPQPLLPGYGGFLLLVMAAVLLAGTAIFMRRKGKAK